LTSEIKRPDASVETVNAACVLLLLLLLLL
jgi:hypothetical protein